MRQAGVIRFVAMSCFRELGRSFFVRKATISGTFDPNVYMIRFVGLPAVLTSGEGWRSDAAKLGRIRSAKIMCFPQIQMLFSTRKVVTSGGFRY